MASSFSRTLRALDEHRPSRLGLAATLVVLGLWGAWMRYGRIEVYASTTQARLEVVGLPHRVATREAGRIVQLRTELGREVTLGEPLAVLDTSVEEQQLEEARVRVAGLGERAKALRQQIVALEEARASHLGANASAVARARVEEAQAEAVAVRDEKLGAIAGRLGDEQLMSGTDRLKAESDVVDSRLKVKQARAERVRQNAALRYDDRQEAAKMTELVQRVVDLEADRSSSLVQIETARAQIERRTIRAPATGRLGNITALQVGDVVKAGDVIATVVPGEEIHVVAELPPSDAIGRVLPGQRARVRVAGFAWTQYGMLDAVVKQVASEPHDGTARVELVILEAPARRIPVQHGLPSSVDIEIERVSPWTLLVRSAGSVMTPPPPPAPAPRVAVAP
jgi:membrane fusion protein (multidrug efflux system)